MFLLICGYALIKSISAGAIGEQSEHEMSPIFNEDDSWSPFLLNKEKFIAPFLFLMRQDMMQEK
jgi:hypothetical protein